VALARQGLTAFVDLFRGDHLAGDHLGYAPLAERVRAWWDLPAIEDRYAAFVRDSRPLARRLARRPSPPGEAFAAYVRMLTIWRRLRYLDPGLPRDLLPARWKGEVAAELFAELDAALRPLADRHARGVLDAV
jgi:phenylacetic acid degradation operon negative regulatory protein